MKTKAAVVVRARQADRDRGARPRRAPGGRGADPLHPRGPVPLRRPRRPRRPRGPAADGPRPRGRRDHRGGRPRRHPGQGRRPRRLLVHPELRHLPLLRHRPQSICDMGATILEGYLPGERFPITGPRGEYGAMCMLGTFSQYGVIHQNSVRQGRRRPAARQGRARRLRRPDRLGLGGQHRRRPAPARPSMVFGVGGIGINAVQGARLRRREERHRGRPAGEQAGEGHGARRHARLRHRRARRWRRITDLTRGQMADSAILTPGLVTSRDRRRRLQRRRQGRHRRADRPQQARWSRTSSCPARSSRCSARPSRAACSATATRRPTSRRSSGSTSRGDLKLDEIITRTYTLDQVNEGYDDLLAGKNVRGVVVHEH